VARARPSGLGEILVDFEKEYASALSQGERVCWVKQGRGDKVIISKKSAGFSEKVGSVKRVESEESAFFRGWLGGEKESVRSDRSTTGEQLACI